ncbi:unnamed protein product [Orchesella dallaii]|uniref:Uncharacterized protein n=1 Tax=Orchesella dallaii TaxID=48710 RepID=A0ABP1QDZ3_9HEXA
MSNENCSNATDSDLYDYLRDLSWLNNDNPEANRALLEGLHSGYTGYMEDQIIQQFSRRSQREMRNQTSGNQGTARNATSLTSHVSEDSDDPEYDKLHYLQLVLYGTSIRGPSLEGSGDPPPPSKKISRPTIGEERKAWLLEARKAYCFNKLQTQPPEVLSQGGEFSGNSKARVAIATCSESDSQYCRSETSSKGLAMKTLANKESCTYIFQQADGTMKPSNIRLSPRMEKLGTSILSN